jgi:hypothetical protein
MSLEERKELVEFVEDVHGLLRDVVFEHPELLPGELLNLYGSAVSEVETHVIETRLALLEVPPESLGDLDDKLENAGLSGDQLALKLKGYWRAVTSFRQTLPHRRFLLRRAFRWANVVLGSLAGVIGAAEPLKELKGVVEAGIEDKDED